MNINSIAFLSNTITRPFDRFLTGYEIVHYPLDTVIEQLYNNITEDIIIILLEASFFKNEFIILQNAITAFRKTSNTKIIINTISDNFNDIYMPRNIKNELALVTLNTKIVSLSEMFTNIAVLDFYTLVKHHGYNNLINEKNTYLFQTPFTRIALELISVKLRELISLFQITRIKAIAVDADNTLWGGIVGEDGIDSIKIDNNYPGIIYKKFQEYLLELQKSGIILILLSKNDEALVKKVFETKNMPLSPSDFVEQAVNWNSKSENLNILLQKLKLTTSNIIFLDDSAVEISEMKERLGIESYKMNPQDPIQNLKTLQNIQALKTLHLSKEDKNKTALYKDEQSRVELHNTLSSKEDFIASLDINIKITRNNMHNIERITQLTNKTNQFNLTTKRYTLSQIQTMMQNDIIYDFSVQDKFGDMGLIGLIIIKDNLIDTFLLSCRILGRQIEESILSFVTQEHPNLKAIFKATSKNSLVENFYENNGFKLVKKDKDKHYDFFKNVDINRYIKVDYDK